MRKIFQDIITSFVSLYFISYFFSGLSVHGGVGGYGLGAFFLTLGDYILKPLVKVLTLPFTLLTFGLFSLLVNGITLFFVTILYPKITIHGFYVTFFQHSANGIYIPVFLSYVLISATIYATKRLIFWLFNER